jgi:hypothetical protein
MEMESGEFVYIFMRPLLSFTRAFHSLTEWKERGSREWKEQLNNITASFIH